MPIKSRLLLFSIFSAFCLGSSAVHAQSRVEVPIFFDDFLADNGGITKNNFRLFFLWNVLSGSVDLAGQSINELGTDPVFGRFVELGGSTRDPGLFQTRAALPLIAGNTYRLSFRYKSFDGLPATGQVALGTRFWRFATSSTTFQQFSQEITIPRTVLAKIGFVDLGRDNAGIAIDTVMLTQIISLPTTPVSALGGLGQTSVTIGVGVSADVNLPVGTP